jgi:hypothetical protein
VPDKKPQTMMEAAEAFAQAWRNLWRTSPVVVVLLVSAVVGLLVAFM